MCCCWIAKHQVGYPLPRYCVNLNIKSWTSPGSDAVQLLSHLHSNPELHNIPVAVMANGKDLHASKLSLTASGFAEPVFKKPSTTDELHIILAAVHTAQQDQLACDGAGAHLLSLPSPTPDHGFNSSAAQVSSQHHLHDIAGHSNHRLYRHDQHQQHQIMSAHTLATCKPVQGMSPPQEHLLHLAASGLLLHPPRALDPANLPSQRRQQQQQQQQLPLPSQQEGQPSETISKQQVWQRHHSAGQLTGVDACLASQFPTAVLGKRSRAPAQPPADTPEYTTLLHGLLLRPGREVSSAESLDIFCQVLCQLQLLHQPPELAEGHCCGSMDSIGAGVPGGVRPSTLLLHRDGVVEFAQLNETWCLQADVKERAAHCVNPDAVMDGRRQSLQVDPQASGSSDGGRHSSRRRTEAGEGFFTSLGVHQVHKSDSNKTGLKTTSSNNSISAEEDALYRSPEEEAGLPSTPASDMFSMGLLFFELFHRPPTQPTLQHLPHRSQQPQLWHEQHPLEQQHSIHQRHLAIPGPHDFLGNTSSYAPCDTDAVLADVASLFGTTPLPKRASLDTCNGGAFTHSGATPHSSSTRAETLARVRLRQLPSSFLTEQPREAAFTLALLAPQPSDRPTLAALMACDALRGTCEALREQWQEQEDEEAGYATLEQTDSAELQCATASGSSGLQSADRPILAEFLTCMRDSTAAEHSRVATDLSSIVADIQAVQQQLSLLQVQHSGGGTGAGKPGSSGACTSGLRLDSPRHLQAGTSNSSGGRQLLMAGGPTVEDMHGTPVARLRSVGTTTSSGGPIHVGHTPGDYDTDMDPQGRPVGVVETRWTRLSHIQPHVEGMYFKHRATAPAPPRPSSVVTIPLALTPSITSASGELRMRASWSGISGDLTLGGSSSLLLDLDAIAPAVAGPAVPGNLQGTSSGLRAGLCLPSSSVPMKAIQRAKPQPASNTSSRSQSNAGLPAHLSAFTEDLHSVVQHERLEVVASVRYGDSLSSTNMVCSTAFDRDDEFFATAGVGKRIRIYETSKLHNQHRAADGVGGIGDGVGAAGEGHSHRRGSRHGDDGHDIAGVHFPVMEISSRSRLSCICWSTYVKNQLVCSDYDGSVQLWDAHTGTELQTFEEHKKRVWSVDFSTLDPTRLVSGSDDGMVKLWSIHSQVSTATLAVGANVCSVQFSPENSHQIALGAANHRVYLYDLRRTAVPLMSVAGHERAVSYVRFLSGGQLASASTDSTLKLWDTRHTAGQTGALPANVQTFRGHRNERNFVGLSASSQGYLACGSEDHNVFVYHRSLPIPVASCEFGGPRPRGRSGLAQAERTHGASAMGGDSGMSGMESEGEDVLSNGLVGGGNMFVSSVCWSRKGDVLLAANSVGIVRLLKMV